MPIAICDTDSINNWRGDKVMSAETKQQVEELFRQEPGLVSRVLIRIVDLDRRLRASGDPGVIKNGNDAEAMRDIAAKTKRFKGLTVRQKQYMAAVISRDYAQLALEIMRGENVIVDEPGPAESPTTCPPADDPNRNSPLWGLF
jgi:hypothetical protein